jgi:hypothetical protein
MNAAARRRFVVRPGGLPVSDYPIVAQVALKRCGKWKVMAQPRAVWFSLLAAALVFSARPAAAQTDAEVMAARQRGVEFLKSKQQPDGNWAFKSHDVGITSLCTIALIENGVPVTDPIIQKAANYVRNNSKDLKNTYDISLVVVMLSRMGDRRDRSQIKNMAARLIAGQMDSGGWHYSCPGQDIDADAILRDFTKIPKPKEGYGDNSCTQFAVLGLWVASRTGVNIDRVLVKVAKRFQTSQLDDGGWAYVMDVPKPADAPADAPPPKPSSRNTMTGAGLFCLAVAQANVIRDYQKSGRQPEGTDAPGKSLLENAIFAKGFKRTGDFVKGLGPGASRYFLWSVERVGVLLGLDQMGGVNWYERGAAALIKEQTEDGGWKSAWQDADPDGLSDTAFALLFLRKANLGSDISRLLEGEPEQQFENVSRKPAARFNTLEEAVADAKDDETIRVNGAGPYKLGHLELKKNITIQAGFGYAPVFKFEVGRNRLGIRLKPETDPDARDMIRVAGGNVTLEGLRLQMDPPVIKQSIPWCAVTVRGGTLRLLNCTISETNKQGSTGVILEAPGQLVARNCQFIGGNAGIEVVANDAQEVLLQNSVVFSNAAFVVSNNTKTKKPAKVTLSLQNSVCQTKEVIVAPKLTGTLDVNSKLCVFQGDWIGSNLMPAASGTKDRSWKGSLNLYDVKQWVGNSGRSVGNIKDIKGWTQFWGNAEQDSFNRIAPFVGLRQVGNFAHDINIQDWQLELPADADAILQRSTIGVNAYLAGSGLPFDQYRETLAYSEWMKGHLTVSLRE